jgi:hypothetical protein
MSHIWTLDECLLVFAWCTNIWRGLHIIQNVANIFAMHCVKIVYNRMMSCFTPDIQNPISSVTAPVVSKFMCILAAALRSCAAIAIHWSVDGSM